MSFKILNKLKVLEHMNFIYFNSYKILFSLIFLNLTFGVFFLRSFYRIQDLVPCFAYVMSDASQTQSRIVPVRTPGTHKKALIGM
jgi:hypothetical protein